ncbi:MAG: penicillin acylase family protein [Alphaproteobacteria bacterium]|nr:penicillin acylase family protein [Alphaproteobacteria bacterium]
MRPRRVLRWIGRGAAALVVLTAALTAGGLAYLSTSVPTLEGRVEAPGLGVAAAIVRDARGVAYIDARSLDDAAFALGYAHAQDRLFQMDLQRRSGAGTLSELFGARTGSFDRFLRTLGFQRLVETDWPALTSATRSLLEAYATGVNAFLAGHEGPWPPEYALLRVDPAPWRPTDCLLVLKSLNLVLGTNMHDELNRLRLAGRLDLEQIADLWPAMPGEMLAPLPAPPILPSGSTGGSNSWVVSGGRTTTGLPLLANDPHLGLGLPGLWYLARMTVAPADGTIATTLAGATVPGLPFLVLGHNGAVAWGFTNAYVDTQDVFVERIDPADPGRYLTPGGAQPFVERDELLRIKGEADQILRMRETRHGPVISDVHWDAMNLVPADHVLTLRWTALDPADPTADAALAVTTAGSVDAFVAASRAYRSPMQTMIVADRAGHIGLAIPGAVPVRPDGVDGSMPAPGWTGSHDWLGTTAIGRLPGDRDPTSGMIVTANARVVPPDFPLLLARDWPAPYRARRIADALRATSRLDVAAMSALQTDVHSLAVAELLPALRAVGPPSSEARAALDLLEGWDGTMAADAPQPLIVAAWMVALWQRLVADELGDMYAELSAPDPVLLEAILRGERARWCDDTTTDATETCPAVAAAALDDTVVTLASQFGADPSAWRWGAAHRARHAHPIFSRIPLVGDLFTIEQPIGGDRYSVDVSSLGWGKDPFVSAFGAGFRAVYDLADLDASRFVIAVGQSGNPFSEHYTDLADAWLAHDLFTIPAEPPAPARILELVPITPED